MSDVKQIQLTECGIHEIDRKTAFHFLETHGPQTTSPPQGHHLYALKHRGHIVAVAFFDEIAEKNFELILWITHEGANIPGAEEKFVTFFQRYARKRSL